MSRDKKNKAEWQKKYMRQYRKTTSGKAAIAKAGKNWRAKNPGYSTLMYHRNPVRQEQVADHALRRKYGKTMEEKKAQHELQRGICPICHRPRRLHVNLVGTIITKLGKLEVWSTTNAT